MPRISLQRGDGGLVSIVSKVLISAFLIAVFVGLVMIYGNSREQTGRLEERTAQLTAQAAWRAQFDKDRAAGALRVAKAEANIREARKQTNELKADIARRDKDAADWIAVRMPEPISALVWLRDLNSVGPVSGGDGTVAGFDPSGESYRPGYER